MFHQCKNYEYCKKYVSNSGKLCDQCKEEARALQKEINIEEKPQWIHKNEGLRRHQKGWNGK